MKNGLKLVTTIGRCFFLPFVFALVSCGSGSHTDKTAEHAGAEHHAGQFFSVKINGVLWEAFPSKEFKTYNLSYKTLSRQFSIFAEAPDGSRMDLSFHTVDKIVPGTYPSTNNDNGILSGIFYYPEAKSSDREMASVTSDMPLQENAVQITKVDKSDKTAYVIEGTFSPVLYASYETNPNRTSRLTEGKFRVIYHPDAINPSF
uniref:hypothetical protein n=1 Tax=Pedobacter schmidteae TaxID=2201271 RepID=UPI000EB1C814|nr:hypothetical protein [Pedobacter schmidteae]